ncbi:MAG: hypothetical protein Q9191_002000 [Dirinaria sp. TL-2023a]
MPEEKTGKWETYTSGVWNSGSHTLALSMEHLTSPDQSVKVPLKLVTETSSPRFDIRGSYKDPVAIDQLTIEHPRRLGPSTSQDVSNDATVYDENGTALRAHGRGSTAAQTSQCMSSLEPMAPPHLDGTQNSLLQTQELPASLRQEISPPKWRLKPWKLQQVRDGRRSAITSSPQSAYGYDDESMQPLVNRLIDEGYIAVRGASGFEVVDTEEQREKRQQAYGDPLKYIAQFYDVLRDTLPIASAEKSKPP